MPTNPAPRSHFRYDKQCSQMSCSPAHFIVKETVAQQDSASPLLEASVVFLPLESSLLHRTRWRSEDQKYRQGHSSLSLGTSP